MSISMATQQLNDICLSVIFERLPIQDRLNAELVCKKWRAVCRESWWTCQRLDACWDEFIEESTGHVHYPLFKVILTKCFSFITKVNFSCTPNYSCEGTLMDDDYYYNKHTPNDFCHMKKGSPKEVESILSVCCNIQELKLDHAVIKCNDKCLSALFKRNKRIRTLELIAYELEGSCFSRLSCASLRSMVLFTCLIEQAQFKLNGHAPPKLTSFSVRHSKIHHRDILLFLTPNLEQLDLSVDLLLQRHHESSFALSKLLDNPSILENLKVLRLSGLYGVHDHFLHLIALHCTELIALDVSYCNDISEEGLQNLAPLKKLKCLQIDHLHVSNDVFLSLNPSLKVLVAIGLDDLTSSVVLLLLSRLEALEKLVLDLAHTAECTEFVENLLDQVESKGLERNVPLELGILQDGFSQEERINIMNTPCPDFIKLYMFEDHSDWSFEKYL